MALLGAAVLVLYLDQQAAASREFQSNLLRHEIFDHVASNVAHAIDTTFDGPVFDTLAAVNHPVLKAGRLDVIAAQFRQGLRKYPQVQSFFVWNRTMGPLTPDSVLFFDRHSATRPTPAVLPPGRQTDPPDPARVRETVAAFRRDPAMAGEIQRGAIRHASSQQIYFALERTLGGGSYDIFARLFWVDASREKYFAILGFVVDLREMYTTMFPALYQQRLAPLLRRNADLPGLELRVLDDMDHVVFGPPLPAGPFAGEARFSLQFYPAEAIRTRTSVGTAQRSWRISISQAPGAPPPAAWTVQPHFVITGMSVVLMLVALALVIVGHRRARQLARMQTDFVSHVSHQLKTPLSLLNAGCETLELERVHSPEKLREYVGIIRMETARLSALVDRILRFSRVDGHARKYEFEPTDLVCLVHDTVEAFNRSLGRAEDIAVDEQGDRPVVNADAVALEQALVNLLDNALKYSTADRRVVVRVGVDGAHATVAVIDHGIGISRRDRRRIFEKFYRGAGAAHSRDGFGVGLAIVAELVKAHRGSVGVTSAPGQGSTFTIRLPLLARGGVAAGARVLDQGIAESTEEAGWNRAHNGATRRRAS